MDFRARWHAPRPLLLDAALGSELTRRGVATPLPLWSAAAVRDAPDAIAALHADHVAAGAEIVTTATFRTTRRALAKAVAMGDRRLEGRNLAAEARTLVARAVLLARRAAPPFVAGSIAPLEECYDPQLVPDDATLAREHAWLARDLADAGVDLLLLETMNTVREAVAAARAARATGLPVIVGFVCGSDGRLMSGETVAAAARALLAERIDGLAINCTPVASIEPPLRELCDAVAGRVPIGAWGNIGRTDDIVGWTTTDDCSPAQYAAAAARWLELGAHLIGGCCGTTPAHLAALRELLARSVADRDDRTPRPHPDGSP